MIIKRLGFRLTLSGHYNRFRILETLRYYYVRTYNRCPNSQTEILLVLLVPIRDNKNNEIERIYMILWFAKTCESPLPHLIINIFVDFLDDDDDDDLTRLRGFED